MIRVWDPFVRAFHWALALSFAVAWLSSESMERVHSAAGYVAGALVAARIVWGFVGPGYARFSQFVRSPATVLVYLKAIAEGSEPRFIGHNPAGGAMIVVLLAAMAAAVATGWLLTTDAFWGSTASAASSFDRRARRPAARARASGGRRAGERPAPGESRSRDGGRRQARGGARRRQSEVRREDDE